MDLRRIFWIIDTKNSRALIEKWAEQAGYTAEDAEVIIEFVEAGWTETNDQLAAAYWMIKDNSILPAEIKRALYICKQLKLDPLKQNPKELIEQNPDLKPKVKPINPDKVLTDRQEDENGNATYAARDEDREILRQIINTHYGEDTNPWCLLQGDRETGELTDNSAEYWKEYSAYPKRVAFRNGKLLAFSAGQNSYREWWDRFDRSFPFIPYNGKTWEGRNGYTYEIRNFHVFKKDSNFESRLSSSYTTDINYAEEEVSIDRKNKDIYYDGSRYKYEEKDGKYVITQDKYGTKCLMIFNKDLLLDGPYERYHDNGQLEVKCTCKNDKLDGLYESYYDDGKLCVKCTYKNGKEDGLYVEYRDNGQLYEKGAFKNGTKEGPYEWYYPNGQLMKKYTYKDGHRNGPYESYYDNGQLYEKCTCKNDKLDGLYESYYKNKQLRCRCTYKDDKREGLFESYYDDGKLCVKCTYKNGKEDGLYERYYLNGQLCVKCIYSHGDFVRNVE